jgi:hypothetical protein
MTKSKHVKGVRLTKKTRKYRKNKNYYGGDAHEKDKKYERDDRDREKDEREGIMDVIGEKTTDLLEETGDYLKEKGLRLIGLEPIKKNREEDREKEEELKKNLEQPSIIDSTIGNIDSAIGTIENSASGLVGDVTNIGSDIVNVFDKGTAAVIGNINDVLESPKIEGSISEALEETAGIGEKVLENFNQVLESPELKEEAKEALDNASDYASIAIKAMDKPIDEAIDKLNDATTEATSGVISGVIKVGTDAMAAVPYVGAVMELGKMLNDGSKAVSSVVESGSEIIETTNDLFIDTAHGIKEGLKELEEKKKEGEKILHRTADSIEKFEKPMNLSSVPGMSHVPKGGSRRTRKKFMKRKGKSKRVRFFL